MCISANFARQARRLPPYRLNAKKEADMEFFQLLLDTWWLFALAFLAVILRPLGRRRSAGDSPGRPGGPRARHRRNTT